MMPGQLERLLQILIQPPQTSNQQGGQAVAIDVETLGVLTEATSDLVDPSQLYGTTAPAAVYGESLYGGHLVYDDTLCRGLAETVTQR